MFQITIPFLYLFAAVAFATGRLQPDIRYAGLMRLGAFLLASVGAIVHCVFLFGVLTETNTINLSLASAVSLIGLQLAVIGVLAGFDPDLRGVSAGLLLLAAPAALARPAPIAAAGDSGLTLQVQAHVFTSMFAYGLLTAGAIVAVYALVQDRRLHAARLSSANRLFAPLETTERLLFGVTTAGFAVLALSVISGITFVENLFAQHLVHKTVLSLLALLVFGVLIGGRYYAGWRGKRAVYLYLGGFALLCLAYFGSRIILEVLLGRSWT